VDDDDDGDGSGGKSEIFISQNFEDSARKNNKFLEAVKVKMMHMKKQTSMLDNFNNIAVSENMLKNSNSIAASSNKQKSVIVKPPKKKEDKTDQRNPRVFLDNCVEEF
jgi:hypothetical protein